ncbi:MAG: P-II family nitrogen regulator [Elusimicrobia bacterium]|nr:P-II family nitrogen regulator [Elusimicrobiota bacterium]
MAEAENLDLVTIIVQHKDERKVLDAILKAGATGATYYYGRGTGVRQRLGLFGRLIESEKLVIISVVHANETQAVVKAAAEAARLDVMGNGFLCVQKATQVVGFFD